MKITWTCNSFNTLSNNELYDILALRTAVFVVEQNCAFQDADGQKDYESYHLQGRDEANELVAYTRLLPAGLAYTQASIGRVVTSAKARKFGIGRQLMVQSIEQLYVIFGKQSIKIGAQMYLKKFYESFGFLQSSDMYLEDGIEHIEMVKD